MVVQQAVFIMLRGRGRARGPASSRVLARARLLNTAQHRGGTRQGAMTATGLPSLTTTLTSNDSQRLSHDEQSTLQSETTQDSGERGGSNVTISHIYETCKGVMGQLKVIDGRLKKIEDKQIKLSDTIKELNDMMKKVIRLVHHQRNSS